MVGDYLVTAWCIASTCALQVTEQRSIEVCLASPIWACFVKTHTKSYIASLSNGKTKNSQKNCELLIYEPASEKDIDTVYVARDSWGIKRVVFACSRDEFIFPENAGIWWQILRISKNTGKLVAQSDVSIP